MDSYGGLDLRIGNLTKKRVSEHIGLPEDDLVLMDVKYSGDATQLRHFLAVDHEHKKVVFCIRGTFCASEIAVDILGHSRKFVPRDWVGVLLNIGCLISCFLPQLLDIAGPFCGGEAHAGISIMTERLWNLVANDVIKALEKNEGYELIILATHLELARLFCSTFCFIKMTD